MKKLLMIGLIVLAVLVVGLLVAWLKIDSIARTGVEQGGTYALGVNTTLDSAAVSLLKAAVGLKSLLVANPEGFKTPHLMKVGTIETGVVLGSLFTDTVEVPRIEIDGLDMNIEQKLGSTNVTALLDHMKAHGAAEKPAAQESGRKFKIGTIRVKNVVAHFQVLPIGGGMTTLDVKVPEITMDNVTSDNASGVAMSQVFDRLVPAILAAVFEKAKGVIPDGDLRKLSGSLASTTQALGEGAARLVGQTGGEAAKALGDLGKGTQKTGEEVIKKNVGGALEGLFGGKKKGEEKPK